MITYNLSVSKNAKGKFGHQVIETMFPNPS